MSDWQERIDCDTAPSIQTEHELRYRLAAPLIAGSATWADLGCGNGIAAAAGLDGVRPPRVVLVDRQADVVMQAAAELGTTEATTLTGDLTDAEVLGRIDEALLAGQGQAVVTCFEVVEHLETFLPLLEWSGALAREHSVSFVMSVPNDAFWGISNPYHETAWGEGAFEELRRLLPEERTLLRQVALAGSAVVGWDGQVAVHELAVAVGGESTVATHFIAAFGPGHERLGRLGLAVQADMTEQRRWERQRESNLAVAEHVAEEQAEALREQAEALRERTVWFEEWRRYIHELERELDRPLSGVSEQELPKPAEPPA